MYFASRDLGRELTTRDVDAALRRRHAEALQASADRRLRRAARAPRSGRVLLLGERGRAVRQQPAHGGDAAPPADRALQLLALPAGAPALLLDVGCGTGYSGGLLERAGHAWVGVDLSELMLRAARARGRRVHD